jgi:hypothetical protein
LLFDLPSRYRISIHGRLSVDWADRLQELTLTMRRAKGQEQVTTLTCEVRDQAALMGVLDMLYDMGLPLLKVERLGPPLPAADSTPGGRTI